MLWVHPVILFITLLLALHVFASGFKRFLCSHCGQKGMFPWKQHVTLGKTVILTWVAGLALGMVMAKAAWSIVGATGIHFTVGLYMFPLLMIAYITGEMLDRVKKKRVVLPLIHGINNTILLALALYQTWTGWQIIQVYMLGAS